MQNTELDILISRVVDARASATDWDLLEQHGAADAGVWKALAMAQRDHSLLSAAVGAAVEPARRVSLPEQIGEEAGDVPRTLSFAQAQVASRARRAATWAGWAAAAALGLAFVSQQTGPVSAPSSGAVPESQRAGLSGGISNATDALKAYLDRGKADGSVIGEQPEKQIVDVVPVRDGGGFEVFYVRRILERARVDNLYRVTSDEAGQPAALPVEAPAVRRPKPAV